MYLEGQEGTKNTKNMKLTESKVGKVGLGENRKKFPSRCLKDSVAQSSFDSSRDELFFVLVVLKSATTSTTSRYLKEQKTLCP